MSKIKKRNNNFNDLALWLLIIAITSSVVGINYFFNYAGPIKAIVWLVWFILIVGIAYFTSQGRQIYAFAMEAKIELQKVVWPTKHETMQTTLIVMIMVVVTSFILWLIDIGMMWTIGKITHLG